MMGAGRGAIAGNRIFPICNAEPQQRDAAAAFRQHFGHQAADTAINVMLLYGNYRWVVI